MKVKFDSAKRAWMITDIHLGVRNSSNEWQNIHREYFFNFFIPLVQKHYRPGDVLLVLGDVYDSRNAINLRVLCLGIDVFEALSKIFTDGIIIVLGNHDVWAKNSNEVNSVRSLKWIPNVHIYEEPQSIQLGKRKFLLMPWRKDHEAEKECVDTMGPGNEYLLCHADIQGFKFNKMTEVTDGCEVKTFSEFKTVYSGHIHYSQSVKNIRMLGSPYQLTRSDMGNPKGVTVLDLETEQETYYENDYSPKFIKMKFTDLLEMSPSRINKIFFNNFVDVYLDGEQSLKAPISTFMDLLDGKYREIHFHPVLDGREDVLLENVDADMNFDLLKFVKDYVESLSYNDDTKKKMYEFIVKLYKTTEQQEIQ